MRGLPFTQLLETFLAWWERGQGKHRLNRKQPSGGHHLVS